MIQNRARSISGNFNAIYDKDQSVYTLSFQGRDGSGRALNGVSGTNTKVPQQDTKMLANPAPLVHQFDGV